MIKRERGSLIIAGISFGFIAMFLLVKFVEQAFRAIF